MESNGIRFEISSNRQVTDHEIQDIVDTISTYHNVDRRYIEELSVEILPPYLMFVITGIVGGFLGAIGSDAWKALKKALNKFIKEKESESDIEFKVESSKKASFRIRTDDPDLVEKAMDGMVDIIDALNEANTEFQYDEEKDEWEER